MWAINSKVFKVEAAKENIRHCILGISITYWGIYQWDFVRRMYVVPLYHEYYRTTSKRNQNIVSKLNDLLATYSVHYMNTRGFHWNIKGKRIFWIACQIWRNLQLAYSTNRWNSWANTYPRRYTIT
jgi:DNA-binding ferritin-like protein (oxidative damage protectant)